MESNNIEVRYNDDRLRFFRAESDGRRYCVQTLAIRRPALSTSFSHKMAHWGAREVVLIMMSASGSRERWHESLSLEDVKSMLKGWRRKCDVEGLTTMVRVHLGT